MIGPAMATPQGTMTKPRGKFCGANRRYGRGPCRWRPMKGSWRCKYHGGRRIGPYNPRGFQPAAVARFEAKRALYRAIGLPWPGGRPRQIKQVMSMVEQAKETITTAIVELEEALPPDIMKVPVEMLTAPQALGRASLVGLHQLVRIVEQKIIKKDLKQQRLIGDMALGANKLLQRHAQGERNHDLIGKLLAALEAEKAPAEEK